MKGIVQLWGGPADGKIFPLGSIYIRIPIMDTDLLYEPNNIECPIEFHEAIYKFNILNNRYEYDRTR